MDRPARQLSKSKKLIFSFWQDGHFSMEEEDDSVGSSKRVSSSSVLSPLFLSSAIRTGSEPTRYADETPGCLSEEMEDFQGSPPLSPHSSNSAESISSPPRKCSLLFLVNQRDDFQQQELPNFREETEHENTPSAFRFCSRYRSSSINFLLNNGL